VNRTEEDDNADKLRQQNTQPATRCEDTKAILSSMCLSVIRSTTLLPVVTSSSLRFS